MKYVIAVSKLISSYFILLYKKKIYECPIALCIIFKNIIIIFKKLLCKIVCVEKYIFITRTLKIITLIY